VLVTSPDKPWRSLSEALAQARKAPNPLTYYTYGPGTAPHLGGILLSQAAQLPLDAVPYKGSADSMLALMRGEVDLGIDTVSAVSGHLKAGKLRALAVTGAQRSSFLPDVPSLPELNLAAAVQEGFYALAAPARTPEAITKRLYQEVAAVLAQPAVREKIAALSLEWAPLSGAELRPRMSADIQRYRALVQKLQLKFD